MSMAKRNAFVAVSEKSKGTSIFFMAEMLVGQM